MLALKNLLGCRWFFISSPEQAPAYWNMYISGWYTKKAFRWGKTYHWASSRQSSSHWDSGYWPVSIIKETSANRRVKGLLPYSASNNYSKFKFYLMFIFSILWFFSVMFSPSFDTLDFLTRNILYSCLFSFLFLF